MGKSFNQIGMDRSLPHIGIIMEKHDTGVYPKYALPAGFSFAKYEEGFENQWVELQYELQEVDSLKEGEDTFYREFLLGKGTDWINKNEMPNERLDAWLYPLFDDMYRRMVFVINENKQVVGTGALWKGDIFGKELQRIHFVAVKPQYQGLGISKAIVTQLLNIYNALGYKGYIYLTSQTWSYKAVNVYSGFGFKPYLGKRPEKWISVNLTSGNFEPWDYETKNIEAWDMINNKIDEYRKGVARGVSTKPIKPALAKAYEIVQISPQTYHMCNNIWDMKKQAQTQKWLAEITIGTRVAYAYMVNGEFLGECSLVLKNDDPQYTIEGKRAYLSRLIVKQSNRNMGIGSILVDYIIEETKQRGFSEISLGVDKDNLAALHLYQGKGFSEVLFEGEDKYGEFYKLLKRL